MTEAELQAGVLGLAGNLGLASLAIPDSRRIVHGRGYPDLTIVGSSLLFAELKAMSGQLTADQRRWKYRLQAAGQQWRLWRPSDWYSGIIETELRRIK